MYNMNILIGLSLQLIFVLLFIGVIIKLYGKIYSGVYGSNVPSDEITNGITERILRLVHIYWLKMFLIVYLCYQTKSNFWIKCNWNAFKMMFWKLHFHKHFWLVCKYTLFFLSHYCYLTSIISKKYICIVINLIFILLLQSVCPCTVVWITWRKWYIVSWIFH